MCILKYLHGNWIIKGHFKYKFFVELYKKILIYKYVYKLFKLFRIERDKKYIN